MNWGFRSWQARPLYKKGQKVESAEVQVGDEDSVALVAPRDLSVTIPAGMGSEIKTSVIYSGPIKAPIKAGQHIADLIVQTPDTPPQSMPLVAEKDIAEAGFVRHFWLALLSLFGLA
jgi:D-alanyl-D-alanine carboxypeptidase (penicillin-binding protein 5/6)